MMDCAQQLQGLCIRPDENVLSVVDGSVRALHHSGATPRVTSRVIHRDFVALFNALDGRRQARPSCADHRYMGSRGSGGGCGHLPRHWVRVAIHSFLKGVKEMR